MEQSYEKANLELTWSERTPSLNLCDDSIHILLYTEDHGVGGIAQFNHSLLCHLVQLGYRVTCAQSKRFTPMLQEQKELGVKHVWLDFDTMKDWSRILYNCADAEQVFDATNPDLVVFSDGWPMSSFAAKQVAIKREIPYVISLGFVEQSYATFSRLDGISYIEAVSYQYVQAEKVIAVSFENLALLQKIFSLSDDKGRVIYYGRPKQYFASPCSQTRVRLRQEFNIPLDAIVCFTAARMTPIKGYHYQLEAIAQLKQTALWPKLYFVWAGPGETTHNNQAPDIIRQVEALGVSDHVKILGQRWDIPDWLDASDIFVLPSNAEGMPLAVMEAMAKGLPVIASAVSGIPEELGNTGQLLPDPRIQPSETVNGLIQTIQDWTARPNYLKLRGHACQKRAEHLFKEEQMLDQYIDMIQGILSLERKNLNDSYNVSDTHKKIDIQNKLEHQLKYNNLIWDAWCSYLQNNSTQMEQFLSESLEYSPFTAIETAMNWVGSFSQFFYEKNREFDSYTFSQQIEWRRMIGKTLSLNY